MPPALRVIGLYIEFFVPSSILEDVLYGLA